MTAHTSPLSRLSAPTTPSATPSRASLRRSATVIVAASTALTLSSCFPLPLGGQTGAVGFDGVQSATIQIEAVGTFVSPSEGGYEAAGRGTGFIIDSNGLAVTNNHVVVGAGTIKVWRGGDTSETLNAKVLGSSECLDLAVIELEGEGYPTLDWHSGDITTAMDVYAAGFPLGDPEFTMTRGIVSKADTAGDTPWASIDHIIEHDARIRGGNSGGPLVDSEGRVVGVNYAGNDQHDMNLAIHRDEVLDVIDQLASGESVLSLGINGTALIDDEGNGLGIWVNSVASGSSADAAGVEAGDLLTRMQGVTLATDGTMSDYCDVLRTHGTDATLSIEIFRPAEGIYYQGQVNGESLTAVSVVGQATGSTGGATGEFQTVLDDSEQVIVEIPSSWNQIDRTAWNDGMGNSYKRIEASTDIRAYQSGWDVPGVSVLASDTALATTTPQDWLDLVTPYLTESGCTLAAQDVYDDGRHLGVFDYWTGCGHTNADYLMVSAESYAGDYLVAVSVTALTESDLDAIDRVVGSFMAAF